MEETRELVKGFLYANDSVCTACPCGMLVEYCMNLRSFQDSFFFLVTLGLVAEPSLSTLP
jgi:hypothetical protein